MECFFHVNLLITVFDQLHLSVVLRNSSVLLLVRRDNEDKHF